MMDQPASDLYAGMRGVGNVGRALTELVQTYRSYLDPTVRKHEIPAYVRKLLGDYTIPSMHFMFAGFDPDISPVNLQKPPYHVAHIVDAIHTDLMGLLRNITLETQTPGQIMQQQMARPEIKDFIAENRRKIAEMMDKRRPKGSEIIHDDRHTEVMIHMMAHCFPNFVPELEFSFKDRHTGDVERVTVPNTLVHRDETPHIQTSKMPGVPLACIAWALGEASKGSILPSSASLFIQFLAGTQEGLTISMESMFKVFRQAVPQGKSLNDYLLMNGEALSQVIRDEAPHLQVLQAMITADFHMTQAEQIGKLLRASAAPPLTLKNPEGPCHTACLLYGAAQGFRAFNKLLDEQCGKSKDIAQLKTAMNKPERLTKVCSDIEKLADEVGKCRDIEQVSSLLHRRDKGAIVQKAVTQLHTISKVFPDIGMQIDGQKHLIGNMLSTPMRPIITEILPEMKLPTFTPRVNLDAFIREQFPGGGGRGLRPGF